MTSASVQPNVPSARADGLREDLYRLLVDAVREYAIVLLDPQGNVASWNAGAERIEGYTSDEIVGRNFSAFYTDADLRAGKPERDLRVAAEAGRVEDDRWRVRKDGSRFWANTVLTAMRDDAGRLRGYGEVTRDLTERRRAQDAERELRAESVARSAAEEGEATLRALEEGQRQAADRLRAILSGVSDGIIAEDADARVAFANDAAARMLGMDSSEQIAGKNVDDLCSMLEFLDERGAPIELAQLPARRAFAGEPARPTVLRVRHRATGRQWWTSVRVSLVRDAKGAPELAITVWHDVSDVWLRQRAARYVARASAALGSSLDYESTLQALARVLVPELADWCVVDVPQEGELRAVAVAHADPAKADAAHAFLARYPAALDEDRGIGRARVFRTGRPELHGSVDERIVVQAARDDEHLAALRALGMASAMSVPIRTEERICGVMTLFNTESRRRFDPEDLKLAEELGRRAGSAMENARLYADAQRAYHEAQDAVRARDEFLSIAGHELRTPLAALSLQLQSLEKAFARGAVTDNLEQWAARLHRSLAQVARLGRLIGQLLDVSRISAGRLVLEREQMDLRALVEEVIDRFADDAAIARAPITLAPGGPITGPWDRARIDQVLTNLLANAVKYGAGHPIDVSARVEDGRAILTVRDRGIGIPADAQARIFGRFERAVSDRNYGGLGLGLWIARQLVEAHRGWIRFESTPGEGATFEVCLPV